MKCPNNPKVSCPVPDAAPQGIREQLIYFGATDGLDNAIQEAEDIQGKLETLCEIGTSVERRYALRLLVQVEEGIKALLAVKAFANKGDA
jgi:hypothetical protein